MKRPEKFIEAEQLNFSYPGADLFEDLSFVVGPGLSLLRGGDGKGKSTLLRLMAGAIEPRSGVIQRFAGTIFLEDPADSIHDQKIVHAWLADLRLRFPGWDASVMAGLIDGFRLIDHIDKPMYMLSTGSRRKVGLVGAAASRAQLTLVDMPFAALDASACRLLNQLLGEAAACRVRAWVIADCELPAGLASVQLSGCLDLGD